jgi:hypothetical protein
LAIGLGTAITFNRKGIGVSAAWLAGGISAANIVAAYEPVRAANLAASYVNLANPGTYDCTVPTVAPLFRAKKGWQFNGVSTYLETGITPSPGWSVIIDYAGAVNLGGADAMLMGSKNITGTAIDRFALGVSSYTTEAMRVNVAGGRDVTPYYPQGVIGFSNIQGYYNGVAFGVPPASTGYSTQTLRPIFIGCWNFGGTPALFSEAIIRRLYIYNTALTAGQMLAVSNALRAEDFPALVMYEDFTTAEAAPLASPRNPTHAGASMVVSDTTSKLSITDSVLRVSGGNTAFREPYYLKSVGHGRYARGRIMYFRIKADTATGNLMIGWANTNTLAGNDWVLCLALAASNAIQNRYSTGNIPIDNFTPGEWIEWALLWTGHTSRAVLHFRWIDGEPHFIYNPTGLSNVAYPAISVQNTSGTDNYVDYFKVVDLGPDAYTTGVAFNIPALVRNTYSSVEEGLTWEHAEDPYFHIVPVLNGTTQAWQEIRFRQVDANNYYALRYRNASSGNRCELINCSAGTRTTVANYTGNVLSNAIRLRVKGSTISVHYHTANDVRMIYYTGASNHLTGLTAVVQEIGADNSLTTLYEHNHNLAGTAFGNMLDAGKALT